MIRDDNSLFLPIKFELPDKNVETTALIDCGAEGTFMNKKFAEKLGTPLTRLVEPITVFNVDGTKNQEGEVTHFVMTNGSVNGRQLRTRFLLSDLGKIDVILGLPWLKQENPLVNWKEGTLEWRKEELIRADKERDKIMRHIRGAIIQKKEEVTKLIPKELHDYLKVFSKKAADRFPRRKKWDHKIELKSDFEPQRGRNYNLSPEENNSLWEFIRENRKKGYIRPSRSPQAAPFFFVKKKDGTGRPCQDYRKLNEQTIPNAYPIPRIAELMDRHAKHTLFTKMDLRAGYNNVRIREGDEWKAAFTTKFGLFEPTVMFFGLCNSPATFQHMMDEIFEEELREGWLSVYIDDLLIGATTKEELTERTLRVLKKLKNNDLFVKPEKCTFSSTKVEFLGVVLEPGKITMDPTKIKGISEWPTPTSVKQVRSFLGFGNFYRKFIKGYSELTKPLNDILKKNQKFEWTNECDTAFWILKKKFTEYPVLRMPNQDLPFQIEADASKYASGAVLTQMDSEGVRHPVAYLSKTFAPAEKNYEIYDRELLAIMRALREWRHYIQGSPHITDIYTDHLNLQYFRNMN
jgi:predicted aspartyl protease